MNNHKNKKRSKSVSSADECNITDVNFSKDNFTDQKEKKQIKENIKSKRNRPRIFSRDFNQLPVSCSPPC